MLGFGMASRSCKVTSGLLMLSSCVPLLLQGSTSVVPCSSRVRQLPTTSVYLYALLITLERIQLGLKMAGPVRLLLLLMRLLFYPSPFRHGIHVCSGYTVCADPFGFCPHGYAEEWGLLWPGSSR